MKVNFKKYFAILLMFFTIVIGTASWVIVGEKSFIAGQHSVSSAVAYIIGKESVKYTSIEKALDVATDGDIVVVVPPEERNYNNLDETPSKPDKVTYYITRDCEIKEGVSLVIPTDAATLSTVTSKSTLNTYISSMYTADRSRGTSDTYKRLAIDNENLYLRVTVEIADSVTLYNNGNLIVGGYLSCGSNDPGYIGHTSHSYSRILLGKNTKIIQNNDAITHCYGFIYEKSQNNSSIFELVSGTLYVPFVVTDYKGFTFSWAMTKDAINKEKCSPFNQFEFNNIDTTLKINYSAKVHSYINISLVESTQKIDKIFTRELNVVGNSDVYFIELNNGNYSYIIFKYDRTTKNTNVDLYGGVKLNDFELEFKEGSVSVDLSTTNSFFPLSYKYTVNLYSSEGQSKAVYNLTNQRVKLLPGSKFIVNDKCEVTGNEFIIYSALYDGSLGNGQYSSNGYNSVKYPLKEGAMLKICGDSTFGFSSLAGTVYGNAANISGTNKTIVSKEAWSYDTNTALIPIPIWITDDYLEIHETLSIYPLSYEKMKKIYVGMNTFTKYNNYLPSLNVIVNNDLNDISSESITISKYQKVIHLNKIINYKLYFVSNVYKAYSSNSLYNKDEVIQVNTDTSLVGVVNSTLSISNNNQGVNEFNVQDIIITCSTPLVDGKPPLYIGKSIKLNAEIINSQKSYVKTVIWRSEDSTIASVDNAGNVTGHKVGSTNIYAYADGVEKSYLVNVLEEKVIISITSVTIEDNSGNSSKVVAGTSDDIGNYNGIYGNNKDITFSIKITPEGSMVKFIEWKLLASDAGRQYFKVSDKTKQDEFINSRENTLPEVTSVTVHTTSGTKMSDDKATLTCNVVGLNDESFTETFIINHKKDNSCFTSDTLIMMNNGEQKQVKDIKQGDEIISFNHLSGKYESSKIAMLVNHGYSWSYVIKLSFSDGTEIKFVNEHGLFSIDERKYIVLDSNNYLDYIGNSFIKFDFNTKMNNEVTLTDAQITTEYIESYSILSSRNINAIANNILTISTGTPGIYNIFELDDNYMVDKELMKQDIEKYGLVTYEEYKDYVPYELFYDFNFEYLNISIAKGLITEEEIARQIEWYYQMIENGEIII